MWQACVSLTGCCGDNTIGGTDLDGVAALLPFKHRRFGIVSETVDDEAALQAQGQDLDLDFLFE